MQRNFVREPAQSESVAWSSGGWVSAARVRVRLKRVVGRIDLLQGERVGLDREYIVEHPIRVWVGDQTAIRPIVSEGRFEIISDKAKVIPRFTVGVVKDDESLA
jgi:hypothetical protein